MSKRLITYLNDHLAGSIAALELLDRLIATYEGKPIQQFFEDLRRDIDADQGELKNLIEKLGEKESPVRKLGLWLAEKFSRAKIRLSGSEENQIGLFHALEGLVLGITGKGCLWTALAAAAETMPQLRKLEYARLVKRAAEQCDRVEAKRLEIAQTIFNSG